LLSPAAQDQHLFVGVGRPDYPDVIEALAKHFQKPIIYRNALSMTEFVTFVRFANAH
jgi:hypothetical protein